MTINILFSGLFADAGILFVETLDSSRGVDDLLLARHKGVALGADFHLDILFGGAGLDHIAANAGNGRVVVGWMDAFFHFNSSSPGKWGCIISPEKINSSKIFTF
jgi:hypothetical protein